MFEAGSEPVRLWLITNGLRIVLVLVLAWAATRALRIAARRFSDRYKARHSDPESGKRADTLSGILQKSVLVLITVICGMVILSQIGVRLSPIIAAMGIGGLAIGFGAQNLVRDIISGFFILMEDQVRVGDVVQLNGQGGFVEAVTLRHIRLRDLSGTVHYFPNGAIGSVANMTKEFSYYVVDMGVAYKEDVDEVTDVMRQVVDEMRSESPWDVDISEPLEILGVDRFTDSAVVVRARIKTRTLRQWAAGREFNGRVKKAFDAAGIEIPFPHRTIYWGMGKQGDASVLHVAQGQSS